MFLISALSKIFLRFTCMCKQTMRMPSTSIRNLDLKSQIPSRTITQTLRRQTATSSRNTSLRQRNDVAKLTLKLVTLFFSCYILGTSNLIVKRLQQFLNWSVGPMTFYRTLYSLQTIGVILMLEGGCCWLIKFWAFEITFSLLFSYGQTVKASR